MTDVLKKVTEYLKSMQLTFEVRVAKGKITQIVVPYSLTDPDLQFKVSIDVSGPFLRFWVLILSQDMVRSKKKQEALYRELLIANGSLAEVKYFLNKKGDIGIVGHEGVDSLNIEGFRDEFHAIPYGIIYFLTTIAKKLKLPMTIPSLDAVSIYT